MPISRPETYEIGTRFQFDRFEELSNADPDGWLRVSLGETADIVRGISFPKDARKLSPQQGHVACLRTANVQRDVEWDDLWFVPEEYVKAESRYVQPLDILISVSNSLELVGKVAQVATPPHKSTLGAFISLLRPSSQLDAKFYYYEMASPEVQSGIRYSASTTTNISNISSSKLSEIALNIPPLAEQRRIVAEIETQFTRLDASVAALRRAQANLRRYRASVLKDACEGRLVPTEAELARSDGRDYEPAGILLERILAERRARWESQEKRRGKYKEPSAPDTSALPELPEGWMWASLEAISELKGGVTKGQRYKDEQTLREVPYLRVANVQRGFLDLKHISTIETSQVNIDQLRLIPGDVLFTEGGDRDKLGRGWVWKGEIEECIHQNHVFRARPFPSSVIPEFASWWGNSFGQDFFSKFGKQTTNLASINLTVLSQFPIPLPPLAEQQRIVAEVERRLSVIQQTEATVEASLARAERLRQSILKQAFSGRLVPQDPDDEPASVLLERIRAEREAEAQAQASASRSGKSGRRSTRRATA